MAKTKTKTVQERIDGMVDLGKDWYMDVQEIQYVLWKKKVLIDDDGNKKDTLVLNGYYGRLKQVDKAILEKHIDKNMARALQGNIDEMEQLAIDIERRLKL